MSKDCCFCLLMVVYSIISLRSVNIFFSVCRTAGSVLGVGFRTFISDKEKVLATVSLRHA